MLGNTIGRGQWLPRWGGWHSQPLHLSDATGPFWDRPKAPGGFLSRWQASSALPLTQRTLQLAAESDLQLACQAAV